MPATLPRLVTVWCPDWPIVAAGVGPSTPAVVLRANRVVACTAAAAGEGVAVGQRRREARRRCPSLEVVDFEEERDAAAFEPVVRTVAGFTPRVEVVEPGLLCFAARGPARYFGGEEAFAATILEALTETSLEVGPSAAVKVGVADGRFASLVAARRSGPGPLIVVPGGSSDFLAPLPIGWLQLTGESSAELVDLLVRLGVRDLGGLAALGSVDVLARFGADGRHAHRLAAGLDDRGADTVAPPEDLRATVHFDEPVASLAPLSFTAKTMADGLAARLSAVGLRCTRLLVEAETDHGERDERSWYRSGGMSAVEMLERVRWQLAGWIASGEISAGVVVLHLVPVEVRGDGGEQHGLWGGTSTADERAERAVARLTSMLGDRGVLVPVWQGGRLPSERCGWLPAATVELTDAADTAHRLGPLATGADGRTAPWPGSLPSPSPTVVLGEPEPVALVDVSGAPVGVGGRGELSAHPAVLRIGDRVPRPVTAWAGPWVLDERWWDLTGRRRLARLQVLCEDGSAFLVASEHRRWWLLASYR